MAAPTIETTGLRRQFPGGVGLESLDLHVEPGQVLALLGPNGAGKTTTVRLLNGVLRPDAGSARVLGLDPQTQGDELRTRTGVLTEHAGLDDRLTARENLRFAAHIRGLKGPAINDRIARLLDDFGMGDRADQVVAGASTGQRKRLGLARALLHTPDVLFLDEPTSGLDPSATRTVVELIRDLAVREGRTVVLCTHFLPEAGQLADQMAVLDRGRLIASGRPADLAASLWSGMACEIDLRGAAAPAVVDLVSVVAGVLDAESTPTGLRLRVNGPEIVPRIVRAVVDAGLDVYAATPLAPTLEDIYFELESRRGEHATRAPS